MRIGTALAAGLLAITAVVAGLMASSSSTPPASSPPAAVGRTQRTLLLAVAPAHGVATGVALLAVDARAGSAAVTLIPTRVMVSVPGRNAMPLGATAGTGSADLAAATADLLGVTVDGTWVLTPDALATLVDRVGGVDVDVDAEVLGSPAADGSRPVIVPKAPHQHLAGPAAAAYAAWLADDEPEQSRQPRLQAVVMQAVTRLPAQPEQVAALVSAVQDQAAASVPAGSLADILVALGTASRAQVTRYSSLPVVALDMGGPVALYRADREAIGALVDSTLSDSIPPGRRHGAPSVLVLDGGSDPEVAGRVREKLLNAGFDYDTRRSAAAGGTPTAVVLVHDGNAPSRDLGQRVVRAVGLPSSALQVERLPQNLADVLIMLPRNARL